MTRNGKIARLPREVREELNRRLQNGEVGKSVVGWLNSRPEVQSVMAAEFGGQPINEPNLTQWKGGGYEDWVAEQESLSEVRLLLEETGELGKLGAEELMPQLALWLTVRCTVEARKQRASGADPDLGAFGRLCRGLSSLRRGEHSERRLKIEEARLKLEERRLELSRGEGSETLEKMFWEWTERPDIREKLFPKPPTAEEQMREYKRILGMDPDREAPAEAHRRKQQEKRAAELDRQEAELDQQEAELERRKAEIERRKAGEVQSPKSEVPSQEGNEDEDEDENEVQSREAEKSEDQGPKAELRELSRAEGNPNSEARNPNPEKTGESPAQGFGVAGEMEVHPPTLGSFLLRQGYGGQDGATRSPKPNVQSRAENEDKKEDGHEKQEDTKTEEGEEEGDGSELEGGGPAEEPGPE